MITLLEWCVIYKVAGAAHVNQVEQLSNFCSQFLCWQILKSILNPDLKVYSLELCVAVTGVPQTQLVYKCSKISLACNWHSTAVCQSVRLLAFVACLVVCVVSSHFHRPLRYIVWAAWKGVRVCVAAVCLWMSAYLTSCHALKELCSDSASDPFFTWWECEFCWFSNYCASWKVSLHNYAKSLQMGIPSLFHCRGLIRSCHLLIISSKRVYFMRRPHCERQTRLHVQRKLSH